LFEHFSHSQSTFRAAARSPAVHVWFFSFFLQLRLLHFLFSCTSFVRSCAPTASGHFSHHARFHPFFSALSERFRVEACGYLGRGVLFFLHITGLSPDPRYPSSQQNPGATSPSNPVFPTAACVSDSIVKVKAGLIERAVANSPLRAAPSPLQSPAQRFAKKTQ
jgi:hypothetical protein